MKKAVSPPSLPHPKMHYMFNENLIKSNSNYTSNDGAAQVWRAWKPWQLSLYILNVQK